MNIRKLLLGICVTATSFGIYTAEASANEEIENVSVFYKNEADKQSILKKADEVEHQLDELDVVVGTFSEKDLEKLQQSKNIEVIPPAKNKLQLASTTTKLSYANKKNTTWNITKVQANNAWQAGISGAGVKVGIIDTALANHSSLPKTIVSKRFISDKTASDTTVHGTFVAGLIAAQSTTKNNVVGISPGVKLYNMNIVGIDQMGDERADEIDYMLAIDYAIENKLDIINVSLGITKAALLENCSYTNYCKNDVTKSITYMATKAALDKGIIVVAAAGNRKGGEVDYPAAVPGAIAVGSTAENDALSKFSSVGKTVSVVAPGEAIQSLSYAGNYSVRTDQGTSFAAPHIVGLLALYKELYPKETASQLKKRLESNTVDLGTKGFDTKFGNGLAVFPKVQQTAIKTTAVKKETAAEKYLRVNKTKNSKIFATMKKKKNVNYLTELTSVYSLYSSLTKSQKATITSYRKKIGISVLSSSAKAKRVKATNLTQLKTKKTSKITFTTAIKPATINSSAIGLYKDGSKVAGLKVTKASSGKSMTIKTTKALSKGTYYLGINTSKMKTKSNKKVKPFMIKYTVK